MAYKNKKTLYIDLIEVHILYVCTFMRFFMTIFKVNRQKTLEKISPRDDLPSCVIALDLGSRGSGYAYWIKEESEFVRIGNVDGGKH